MSLDLICPQCKSKTEPIKYDTKDNVWWHRCGYTERAKKVQI